MSSWSKQLSIAALVVSFGCGTPVIDRPDGGSGGGSAGGGSAGGGSAGGGSAGGGSAGGGSAGGGSAGGGSAGGGSAGGGSAGGGSGGGSATCGGFIGQVCSGTDVCIWFDKSCGNADQTGSCQSRPQGCTANYDPVCGCDGQTYSNECEAHRAGTDVTTSGSCTPPSGMFHCGWKYCALNTYCQAVVGGAVGNPGSYSCNAFPTACGATPSCMCLQGQTCGGMCSGSAATGLTLTCLVP